MRSGASESGYSNAYYFAAREVLHLDCEDRKNMCIDIRKVMPDENEGWQARTEVLEEQTRKAWFCVQPGVILGVERPCGTASSEIVYLL